MQIKEVMGKNGRGFEVSGDLGIDSHGKRRRARKRGFPTKTSAKEWFVAERISFKNGTGKYVKKKVSEYTIADLYEIWIPSYQNTVEESTLKHTLDSFRLYILPTWGNVQVDKIEPLELQKFVNDLQQKIIYYKKVVNYMKRIVQYGLKLDIVTTNPFLKITLPPQRKAIKKGKQFLETVEFQRFIQVLDQKYIKENQKASTLLRLIAMTGMRTEEVLALQWKHVNFSRNRIKIEQAFGRGIAGGSYLKGVKSRSSNRSISVAKDMMEKLRNWYQVTDFKSSNDFVFGFDGKPLQMLRPNKWLHDVARKYHVADGISIHKLRHTWATLALEQGASVKQVQNYLGHADSKITLDIYSGLTDKSDNESGEILSGLI